MKTITVHFQDEWERIETTKKARLMEEKRLAALGWLSESWALHPNNSPKRRDGKYINTL